MQKERGPALVYWSSYTSVIELNQWWLICCTLPLLCIISSIYKLCNNNDRVNNPDGNEQVWIGFDYKHYTHMVNLARRMYNVDITVQPIRCI